MANQPQVSPINRRLIVVAAALGIFVMVLLCVVMFQWGRLSSTAQPSASKAAASSTNDAPPVKHAQGSDTASQGSTGSQDKDSSSSQPPSEIVYYLENLKRIENKKQNMTRQQIATAMTMQQRMQQPQVKSSENNTDDATWRLQQSNNENIVAWKNLIDEFQLSTPPIACQDLHTKYLDHLTKAQQELSKIQQSSALMQSDPAQAMQLLEAMKQSGGSDAVEAARQADEALKEICNRYQIQKTVEIKVNP